MTEFITRNYGNKEFEVIIKTDSKEHYKEIQDFARKLIDHAKPQTNADRIRAMSDEELAKMLYKTGRNYRAICADPVVDFREHYGDLLQWLQQPVKENDYGN